MFRIIGGEFEFEFKRSNYVIIFIVFAPILINSSLLFEIRLIIIYIAASIFVLYPGFRRLTREV